MTPVFPGISTGPSERDRLLNLSSRARMSSTPAACCCCCPPPAECPAAASDTSLSISVSCLYSNRDDDDVAEILYALLAEDTPDVEEAALVDPPPPPRPPCSLSLLSRSRYCWCGGISCCVLPLAES